MTDAPLGRTGRVAVAVATTLGASLVGLATAVAQPQAVTYYTVTNYNSGKCLDVPESSGDDGQGLEQYACNGGRNQQWALQATDSGYYLLVNLNSGKCADVRQSSQADNAVVNQYGCTRDLNQQWLLRAAPAGINGVQLVARHSAKCLAVAGSSQSDKAGIVQFTCGTNAAYNQYWQFN
ncbi:RICIN domain-containing protein [Streptomyces sp. MBT65]|uniref:RICIN domain-containing protein n=1 Tax=Streptomyces sp. MBT65 TaxID=1488395 RepID=UPI00190CC6F6|nr:RICIN domain-containing protein [Streptomyces sp. MBT65]MBK3575248.1 RICIN domain-containing protein [Streptomyces sp. MBT65]